MTETTDQDVNEEQQEIVDEVEHAEVEEKAEAEVETESEDSISADDALDKNAEISPVELEQSAESSEQELDADAFEESKDEDPVVEGLELQRVIEGALFAAGEPLPISRIQSLFEEDKKPSKEEVNEALEAIQAHCEGRGYALKEVGNGWRFFVQPDTARWVNRLWDEKPQKYSRALLETLALIAYRQPLTRGDIEEVRGVAVSSHIIKTLTERDWVKVVGHRDVPGRPALYATTKTFLDYFNLNSLDELPSLGELKDIDSLNADLAFEEAASASSEKNESSEVVASDAANDTFEQGDEDKAESSTQDTNENEEQMVDQTETLEEDGDQVNSSENSIEGEEVSEADSSLDDENADSENLEAETAELENSESETNSLDDTEFEEPELHSSDAETSETESEEENPNG